MINFKRFLFGFTIIVAVCLLMFLSGQVVLDRTSYHNQPWFVSLLVGAVADVLLVLIFTASYAIGLFFMPRRFRK